MVKIGDAWKKIEIKTGILLIVGAIVFAVAIFSLGRQILISCQLQQTRLLEKRSALAAAQEKVAGMKDYQAQKRLLGDQLAEFDLHIDWDVRRGVNYFLIGQLAAAHQLILVDTKPEPALEERNCLQTVLQISLRGEYLQMISFLRALDADLPNAVEIRRIQIEIDKKAALSDPRPDLILSCQLVTYIKDNPSNMRLNSSWTMNQGDVFYAPPGTEASTEAPEVGSESQSAQDEAKQILPTLAAAQDERSISEDREEETSREADHEIDLINQTAHQETDNEIDQEDQQTNQEDQKVKVIQETEQGAKAKTRASDPATNKQPVGETDGFLIQTEPAQEGNYHFPLVD